MKAQTTSRNKLMGAAGYGGIVVWDMGLPRSFEI
jgi:hypothetical protein